MNLGLLDRLKVVSPPLVAHELSQCPSACLQLASSVVLEVPHHQPLQMLLTPGSALPKLEFFTRLSGVATEDEVGDLPVGLLLLVVASSRQTVLLRILFFSELANNFVQPGNLRNDIILRKLEVEL